MKNKLGRISKIVLALTFVITMMPLSLYAGEFSYTEIITPKYDDARTFSEGLAAVRKDGKWGYIDVDDNVVLDFKYDVAYSFSEGKAIVGTLKLKQPEWVDEPYEALYWGVIDRDGNYKPFMLRDGEHLHYDMYDSIEDYFQETNQLYYNGMVMFSIGDGPDRFIFDGNGKDMGEYLFPQHVATEDILAVYDGYVDLNGNRLFKDKTFAQTRPFNQGLAPVSFYDDNDQEYYWTIMDRSGKTWGNLTFSDFYVSGVYSKYQIFNDNSLLSISDANGKWGAVNKAGKTIIPFKYDKLQIFQEGVAGFKKDGKFGIIDIDGNIIVEPQFDGISSFSNGLATVHQGDNAYIIDKKGNKVEGTDKLPKDTYFSNVGDSIVVYSPGKHVLINQNSKYGFGQIDYTPSLPAVEEMSSWALGEVVLAIESDLVPANLQNMYKTDITRGDFAALVVAVIEEVTGEDINDVLKKETGESLYELVDKYPFKDTTDQNVIAAQALKIINGKGEGKFAPYDKILRQEAAALLTSTAKFLGDETELKNKTFNDQSDIADYAKGAVNYVSSMEVMGDMENNKFGPRESYTREQAYVTIYRLFDVILKK